MIFQDRRNYVSRCENEGDKIALVRPVYTPRSSKKRVSFGGNCHHFLYVWASPLSCGHVIDDSARPPCSRPLPAATGRAYVRLHATIIAPGRRQVQGFSNAHSGPP